MLEKIKYAGSEITETFRELFDLVLGFVLSALMIMTCVIIFGGFITLCLGVL